MPERLVDVLNGRDTVLSVIPVDVEAEDGAPAEAECVDKALKVATDLQLVPDAEIEGMHARMHVGRGGQLAPVADVLKIRQEAQQRAEQGG